MGLAHAILVHAAAFALAASTPRDARWAEKLEGPGLRNFHRVAPGLYRGAQPTAEGMRHLRKLGIRTVIELRLLHSVEALRRRAGLPEER